MRTKSLSPAKSGEITGTFKPSLKLGQLNRAERRALLHPNKAVRKQRIREARENRKAIAAVFAQRKPTPDADES